MHAAEDPASELIRSAARGASLNQLLDLGARTLLTTGRADRAGVWLAGDRRGESGKGRVVEATHGPIPAQWRHLDVSTPFLRAALESSKPLRVEFGTRHTQQTMPDLGPLVGMHSAVWVPLRTRNFTFGLAMAGYARPTAQPDVDALLACGDEIALAVRQYRDARRDAIASEEIRAQLQLSRAILCGVSVDSMLPQIARAARHHLQAEFAVLGQGPEPPLSGECWDGPEEWFTALQQEPILKLWRRAVEQGQSCEIPGESLAIRAGSALDGSNRKLDRVVAVPVEARDNFGGVLMAGLLPAEDSSEDIARLESYALLAASALDRECAREERTAWKKSLEKIIEDSHECLAVIDQKGKVLETSRAGAALLFPACGRRNEVLLEDFFSSIARGAVTQWRKRLAARRSGGASRSERPRNSLKAALLGGNVIRLHLRSEIEGLGGGQARWLIYFEDQSAQQTSQSAAGRLEAELAGVVDSIDSGVVLFDAEGNIRMASDRLAAILGFKTRQLAGLGNFEALIDSVACHFTRPVETAARWRKHALRGEEASWDEFELNYPSRRIVEQFAKPVCGPDGTRLGRLEVYRDVTGQRLIQSKLLQTEKMAALGQLVSGIAHELNNPLTSIQGYAQLLLSRRSTLDRAGDARRISQEAERAGRIVKNLLLFSRETKPERRAVDLNEVIERTLSMRAYELKLENIAVELALDPALPNTLADAAQLQQVVLNLIVNAEQAIVQWRAEETLYGQIRIHTRRLAGDRIAMQVSDDGPGISPEVASRIFDPFFTTKPAGVGTGLGLSIVYGIIQEHGGEVSVETQSGQGATLNVELPALSVAGFDLAPREPAAVPRAPGIVPLSVSSRAATRPERILVVEDEPTVAQLIADVMTEEGHRVDTLLDSRDAVDRLEEKKYALVICDLKMPHVDGPGLYRELVRRESPLQQRILFVTGDTMSPRTCEFLQSSGLPYLAKPFLVEELKQAVRQAFAALPAGEGIVAGQEWPQAAMRKK